MIPPTLEPAAIEITAHDGLRLMVWDYGGEGPPLLLCHCTGTLGRIWDPVVAQLDGQFRVLALDTRGQGDSAAPPERALYEWWRSGDDLLALLEHFDLEPGLLACGHSAGGAHVSHAELAAPGTFSRVVLIDPIIAPEGHFGGANPLSDLVRRRVNVFPSRAAARERFARKPPMQRWHPDVLDAYVRHAFQDLPDGSVTLKCPGGREAWFYELGGAQDVFARLPEIQCPVLLMTGSDSYVAPITEQQEKRLPHAERMVVEGAGHFIPQEQPERVAQILKEWLVRPS